MTAVNMISQRARELLTAMVQRIRGDKKTFAEVAGSMISVV